MINRPYYRKVTIDNSGQITQFVYSNLLEKWKTIKIGQLIVGGSNK